LLYSGEHFDGKLSQQYLRARFYSPTTGRFNRLDDFFGRIQDPQSLHKYAYVHGEPVQGVDPTGKEFSLSGMLSAGGISAAVGGISASTIAAIQGKSAKEIAWAGARGAALGFKFGAAGYGAAAVGVNAILAGSALGALEGGIEAWLTGGNPWEGAVVGGVFGGLLGWVGPAVTKRVGQSLKELAEKIAANAPIPNPSALQALVTDTISGWTARPGGLRLAKVGDYFVKEIDPHAVGVSKWYAEGALKAHVQGLKRLGTLAPEYTFENGRLIVRDVGSFDGPISEFLQIKLLVLCHD
jgi:RHS repeat-associated protein